MAKRPHHIGVVLNDQELARLDELRGQQERAVYLRCLLSQPPDDSEPTYGESLRLLAASARAGKVQAQVALERALRGAQEGSEDGGWLERILNE
jgi:hypothetical protein